MNKSNARILICETDPLIAELEAKILERFGFELPIVKALSHGAARELVESRFPDGEHFDVVIACSTIGWDVAELAHALGIELVICTAAPDEAPAMLLAAQRVQIVDKLHMHSRVIGLGVSVCDALDAKARREMQTAIAYSAVVRKDTR